MTAIALITIGSFLILVVVFLFTVYATNLVRGNRLFLRSSEPISSLQIMAEENNETKIPQGQNGHESAVIPPNYVTNLLGGKRLFLRSSEPISSLQIMAEENNETKIPQGQNGHESAVIPPMGGKRLFLRSSEPISSLQIMAEENRETKIPQGQNGHGSAAIPPRTSQKMKWPEVVGLTVEEAERIIKEEKPGVQIQVLRPNSVWTCDYKVQRVRLHVDSSGKVHRPPIIG